MLSVMNINGFRSIGSIENIKKKKKKFALKTHFEHVEYCKGKFVFFFRLLAQYKLIQFLINCRIELGKVKLVFLRNLSISI